MGVSSKNKLIAKNTITLFFRMAIMMIISLYTSRVVLKNLGIDDFGIYNVVGGLVAVLAVLNGSLTNACSRFITFYIGKHNEPEIAKLFGSSKVIFYGMIILIITLGETIGLWFLYKEMVIPDDRMNAAFWVYQSSLFATVFSILSVPYISLLQAYEKMTPFAYISIVDVIFRLVVALSIVYTSYDRLIVYALLSSLLSFFIFLLYYCYCRRRFYVCKLKLVYDKSKIIEITKYACWTMIGFVAIIGYTQGLNILLNIFYYPAINAARGIAVQVQSAAQTFVDNFLLGMKPQIVKSYAQNDLTYMHKLIGASSKYGFYLIMLLCFPLSLFLDPLLSMWLETVPEYTASFVRIFLIISVLQPFRITMINGIHATGNIKKFQILEGGTLLTVLPIAYFVLTMFNVSPSVVFIIHLFVEIAAQIVRFCVVLPMIKMSFNSYFKKALLPTLPFSLLLLLFLILPLSETISFLEIVFYSFIGDLLLAGVFYSFGLSHEERTYAKSCVYSVIHRIK